MPLIGAIAARMPHWEARGEIAGKLKCGRFVHDPDVSSRSTATGPFFIMGEGQQRRPSIPMSAA